MLNDINKIIPIRFQNASYEDVPEEIKATVTKQIRERNGVYFYGGSGVGKTHMVCALMKNFFKNGLEVMFLNTSDFLEQLREEFDAHVENYDEDGLFRRVMNFRGILIFDDIGSEKVSDWTRERLYLIINKKYEDMIPMIFTSNNDMEILSARVGDRISSRIMGMTEIVKVDGEDIRFKKSNETN